MNEKYLDALYRFQEMLEEDFCAFVDDTERRGLTERRISYADTLMHLAKNLRKEQLIEEGLPPEEIEKFSGGTQGDGRAIRTTPGMNMNQSGRSMRGNGRSGHTAYSGDNSSGKRDSMGRYASSGAEDDFYSKMQRMADLTTNHDEREMIMNMIDRLKNER